MIFLCKTGPIHFFTQGQTLEISRIQQEILTGISKEYLNMPGNALKMQIHEYFGIFLHYVNILFAYVWYVLEFLTSAGILNILFK